MIQNAGNFRLDAEQNAAPRQVISAQNGEIAVEVPSADFISAADIGRDGQDLVLTAPDGSVIVIEGYFTAIPAPLIQGPDGSALTPALVNAFVQGAHAGEYAAAGAADESPVGRVSEVSGHATVTRTDGTVEILTTGMEIYEGDVVETEADGAVNIVFVDESTFAIAANARMAIDEYVFDPATDSGTTNVSMLRGMFVYTSGLIGREDPDDVHINTPMGSIGIRGTVIAGNVDTGEITVVEGAIVLRTHDGQEVTLATQYETAQFGSNGISHMGVTDPADLGVKFAALSDVNPSFFSTLGESQQQNQQDQQGDDAGKTDSQGEPGAEPASAAEQEALLFPDGGFDFLDAGGGDIFNPEANTFGADEGLFGSDPLDFQDPSMEFSSDGDLADDGLSSGADSGDAGSVDDGTQNFDTTGETPPPPPPPPPSGFGLAPAFSNGGAAFGVNENAAVSTVIGSVLATDPESDPLTYTITAGDPGGLFSIDSAGVLSLAGALDFESLSTYTLTVEISDGGNVTTDTYTINVSDINEAPVAANGSFSIAENTAVAAVVGTVTATDPDAAALLTYSITAGNTGGAFSINAATGQITVANPLDFETLSSYTLTVDVTDGTNTDSATITITLTGVDDESSILVTNTGVTATEGAQTGVTNVELSSSDADSATSGIIYTITTAPANGFMALTVAPATPITSFTQAHLVAGQVIYVHNGSETIADSFIFSVGDGINPPITGQTFSITVTPVDDAPVYGVNTGVTVNETASMVLTTAMLSASDADTPDASLVYTIVSVPANGHIAFSAIPGTPITSFSQADLVAGIVIYVHDGSETTADSFDFTVGDGTTTLTSATFNITVTPQDDIINISGSGGTVNGSTGVDIVTITGGTNTVDTLGGNDTVTISGAGNSVTTGLGADTVTNTGNNTLINTGAGADTITLSGGTNLSVIAGSEDDIINLSSSVTISAFDGGTGFDEIYLSTFGSYTLDGAVLDGFERINAQNGGADMLTVDYNTILTANSAGAAIDIDLDGTDTLHLNFGPASGFTLTGGSIYTGGWATFSDGTYTVVVNYTGSPTIRTDLLLNLNNLVVSDGFWITDNIAEGFGGSLARLGDIDNDGFDNLAMGKDNSVTLNSGAAFVLDGQSGLYASGSIGSFGAQISQELGFGMTNVANQVMAAVGDFNNDGFIDYIVGSKDANDGAAGSGDAVVVSGDGTGAVLADFTGFLGGDNAGASISGIGDINGDGFEDILVGSPGDDNGGGANAGSAYVIFGGQYAPGHVFDVNTMSGVQTLGSITSNDIRDIFVKGNLAIVVSPSDDALRIYDISNPGSPSIVGLIDTGISGGNALDGAKSVFVSGNFAYVASGAGGVGGTGSVTIVNISTPSTPVVVGTTGSMASLNGIEKVVVAGSYAYVSTSSGNLVPVNISVPASPSVGTAITVTGIKDVAIEGTKLYVSYDSGTNSGINVYDIGGANAATPSILTATGNLPALDNPGSIAFFGNFVYVASTGTHSVRILDANNITGGVVATISGLAGAEDIAIRDGIMYVTSIAGDSIWAYNLLTDAANPPLINTFSGAVLNGAEAVAIDNAGNAWVASSLAGTLQGINLLPDGFRIEGLSASALTGANVTAAGDFNNDGVSDFVIAAPGSGNAYIVLGKEGMTGVTLTSPNVLTVTGISVGADLQIPVFNAGDINGDGVGDLAIGHTAGSGQIKFLWGGNSPNVVSDFEINVGVGYDMIGGGAAGDFDGDGFDDMAVALRDTVAGDIVHVYVVFGSDTLPAAYGMADLNNTAKAFHITYQIPAGANPATFEFEVTGAGDINGDGFYDLAIGLPDKDANPGFDSSGDTDPDNDSDGSVAIIYGRDTGMNNLVFDNSPGDANATANDVTASANMQSLMGSSVANILSDGNRIDTVFYAGGGNDIIRLNNGNFDRIDGGAGNDAINFLTPAGTLDFSSFAAHDIARIENLNMTMSNQTLRLTLDNIFHLLESSDTGNLRIGGVDASNTLQIDDQGAGSMTGASKEMIGGLLGADTIADGGSFWDFNIGSHTLQIAKVLVDNTQVDII